MYKKCVNFSYPRCGAGRPQILLLGNGLERCMGQCSWESLLRSLQHPNSPIAPLLEHDAQEEDEYKKILPRIPFPLQYELYCSNGKGGIPQPQAEADAEYQRFVDAVRMLDNAPNDLLRQAVALGADHIFTTNYSYCLENSFMPSGTSAKLLVPKSGGLSRRRLYLGDAQEKKYRLHTCYVFNRDSAQLPTGVWHIHGETSVPQGIVLGHDGYGRMLGKITEECRRVGSAFAEESSWHTATSWPELFLFADIYVLGFSFGLSEFDLWWLLKRKHQERRADGQVYFYEQSPAEGFENAHDPRLLLLRANGVTLLDAGLHKGNSGYMQFYERAMEDIQARIAVSQEKRI